MFKICPSCGQEFQSWAAECSDCHVPLQIASETLASEPEPAGETLPSAPLEDPVVVKLGEPWELRALAQSLQERGISSQIDTYPLGAAIGRPGARGQAVRLGIYVARADVEAVREFAAELAGSEPPEDADAELDPGACPACGEPLAEDATSCRSCGLEFPEAVPDAGER